MEEMNALDMLLDEENNDNIVLYDENDNPVEFEQVAVIPLDERLFAILKPVKPFEGIADDEALVFEAKEVEDEEVIVIVDDDELATKVFEVYYDLLREEGVEV